MLETLYINKLFFLDPQFQFPCILPFGSCLINQSISYIKQPSGLQEDVAIHSYILHGLMVVSWIEVKGQVLSLNAVICMMLYFSMTILKSCHCVLRRGQSSKIKCYA